MPKPRDPTSLMPQMRDIPLGESIVIYYHNLDTIKNNARQLRLDGYQFRVNQYSNRARVTCLKKPDGTIAPRRGGPKSGRPRNPNSALSRLRAMTTGQVIEIPLAEKPRETIAVLAAGLKKRFGHCISTRADKKRGVSVITCIFAPESADA